MGTFNILKEIKTLDIIVFRKMQFEDGVDRKNLPTPTQMQILEYIFENEGKDIYQKDLENIFNLSRATVSSVLQTMEKYNLIDRVVDGTDTRTKKIVINKKTKEIFKSHKERFKKIEQKLIQDINNNDLEIFCKVLEKMKENILKED